MRSIREPLVVAPPAGARIRTRLRLSAADQAVVWAVGEYLGGQAGVDLAWRCRLGSGTDQRTIRKRTLTGRSSSRWAGSITRTSNDQWQRASANLTDRRIALQRAAHTIRSRLSVPVGQRQGRVRGYASRAERFAKQGRLQHLQAELAEVEGRLASGRVSVCRGGRRLAKQRHTLDQAKLTERQWRARWQAARLLLTADGEADKRWGNETIRVHPDEGWLELRLPTPLAHLSNTPGRAPTYRLACPAVFTHRAEEWAAQVATGAVRYDIAFHPAKGRWYLDASWQIAAVISILRLAMASGCRSLVVEDLDFADARQNGRETLGRGRRGKSFRRTVSGMPTSRFRTLLVGMAANQELWVIAIDPAWTSKWGQRYWQTPLKESTRASVTITRHHAAAVVIGRRGLGLGARRRSGVPGHDRRIVAGELPARPDHERSGCEGPGPPGGQRAAPAPCKTRPGERNRLGDQVVQDRTGPPGQDKHLLNPQER